MLFVQLCVCFAQKMQKSNRFCHRANSRLNCKDQLDRRIHPIEMYIQIEKEEEKKEKIRGKKQTFRAKE